jgi:predicted oxidoreductase
MRVITTVEMTLEELKTDYVSFVEHNPPKAVVDSNELSTVDILTDDLYVDGVASSCGFGEVEAENFKLMSNESLNYWLQFDIDGTVFPVLSLKIDADGYDNYKYLLTGEDAYYL